MLSTVGPPHWNLNIARNQRVGSGRPSGNDVFKETTDKARWLSQRVGRGLSRVGFSSARP